MGLLRTSSILMFILTSVPAHAGTAGAPLPLGNCSISAGAYSCIATWYGPGFDGRRTASGQIFDMDGLTAAHKTYPFGTMLRVTNPKNGKSVDVTVNDRGPFDYNAEIDLSRGASRAIGCYQTQPVMVEVLGAPPGGTAVGVKTVEAASCAAPDNRKAGYRVQVGSFADAAHAEEVRKSLLAEYPETVVRGVSVKGTDFHRVQAGPFGAKKAAREAAEKLKAAGYKTLVVEDRE
ncbi:MAG TPA: septal ring lytic transglycosylase RlpA family protein [Nitrospirota bacterium]